MADVIGHVYERLKLYKRVDSHSYSAANGELFGPLFLLSHPMNRPAPLFLTFIWIRERSHSIDDTPHNLHFGVNHQ